MDRVSSQFTILLRIALPTMWAATVFSLIVLLAIAVRGKAYIFSNPLIWITVLVIIGTGLAFFYFTTWRLYRVDMDARHVYISDYFKTFKYPYSDIEKIVPSGFMPRRVFGIHLKAKGSFGKVIYFLASQKLWNDFRKEHPAIFETIYQEPVRED